MDILKIDNLNKHFGGIKAVDDCSFKVERGQITALIGPNGSGKTTVFNLISGLLKPNGGQIWLADKKITHLAPAVISNLGISRVFQQSRLFSNLSVIDNLLLAFDNEDQKFWASFLGLIKNEADKRKIINDYLALVRLERVAHSQTKELSFGQRRLVEILRALINPHTLLILDEPVAGVTPELRDKIRDLLLELKAKGETILLIEHDMNFTLKLADRVVVMDAGQVIAEGTPAEIKNNPQVLEAYLD